MNGNAITIAAAFFTFIGAMFFGIHPPWWAVAYICTLAIGRVIEDAPADIAHQIHMQIEERESKSTE